VWNPTSITFRVHLDPNNLNYWRFDWGLFSSGSGSWKVEACHDMQHSQANYQLVHSGTYVDSGISLGIPQTNWSEWKYILPGTTHGGSYRYDLYYRTSPTANWTAVETDIPIANDVYTADVVASTYTGNMSNYNFIDIDYINITRKRI
jgi:hypothetical protein